MMPITISRGEKKPLTAKTNPSLAMEFDGPSASKPLNALRTRGIDDDALSRYPNLQSVGGFLRGMDYLGTLTFALTGSVTAAQSGLDLFGCAMIGMITAVGGGTIRDAVFLSKRPFWTSETEYIWMTILTGCIAFFAWPHVLEWRKIQNEDGEGKYTPPYDRIDAALDALDAIGLAAFAIIGAQNGIRAGMPMIVSAICGMTTSTFGGLTRDVVCGRPVRIAHSYSEVYALPALAGAFTYLWAKKNMVSPAVRIGSAFAICMGFRFIAIKHDIRLHSWDTQHDGLGVARILRCCVPTKKPLTEDLVRLLDDVAGVTHKPLKDAVRLSVFGKITRACTIEHFLAGDSDRLFSLSDDALPDIIDFRFKDFDFRALYFQLNSTTIPSAQPHQS